MIELFGYAMLAGFGLAIPVGPMAILLVTTTLQRGMAYGAVAGLGMITVDFIYAFVSFALGSTLLNFFSTWGKPLTILGALILLFFGFKLLATSWRQSPTQTKPVVQGTLWQTYRTFVAATFVNPATAFYFLAITAGLGRWSTTGGSQLVLGALVFALGVLVASGLWQEGLAIVSGTAKRAVTPALQRNIGIVGGALVVILALQLGVSGLV